MVVDLGELCSRIWRGRRVASELRAMVGGWGRAGIASEPPERTPRTWGRRPSVADPSHPGLKPAFEPGLDLARQSRCELRAMEPAVCGMFAYLYRSRRARWTCTFA